MSLSPAALSHAAIRARAGDRCECKGECQRSHYAGRCPRLRSARTDRAHFPVVLRIVRNKLYCDLCAGRLSNDSTEVHHAPVP